MDKLISIDGSEPSLTLGIREEERERNERSLCNLYVWCRREDSNLHTLASTWT